jgi:predicted dehydrogenase
MESCLNVAFIGAGGVNFGGVDPGSPWDHASRLETLRGEFENLKVVGISDVDQNRLNHVMEIRKKKANPIWSSTRLFTDYMLMLEMMKPNLVFIGVPPSVHGEIEIECAKRGIHMFIEKPLSCNPIEFVTNIRDTIRLKPHLIVSVGYMLRYHKAIQYIHSVLKERNLRPINILARYNSAYTAIPKPMWWDTRRSGGPIIEQGTHFCDLARYFGGNVKLETVTSVAVSANSDAGKLSSVPSGCEVDVPMEFRINRATNSHWKFESGAIGSIQHSLLMKGEKYHTEFEIWCDGLSIRLKDPYSDNCVVEIYSESADPIIKIFPDDPYLSEDRAFLNAVCTKSSKDILSTYDDAVETYILSFQIQNS